MLGDAVQVPAVQLPPAVPGGTTGSSQAGGPGPGRHRPAVRPRRAGEPVGEDLVDDRRRGPRRAAARRLESRKSPASVTSWAWTPVPLQPPVAPRAAAEQEPVAGQRVAHRDVEAPPGLGRRLPVDVARQQVRLGVRGGPGPRPGARRRPAARAGTPARSRRARARRWRRAARRRRGAAGRAGTRASWSALDRAGGQAADDVALQELEQRHRRDGEDAACRRRTPRSCCCAPATPGRTGRPRRSWPSPGSGRCWR